LSANRFAKFSRHIRLPFDEWQQLYNAFFRAASASTPMLIKPRIRGFICTTAHPAGCAALVNEQIALAEDRGPIPGGPLRALVIGGSGGYGLSSRVVAAFGAGAKTLCLSFEKEPAADRTATAGWYNNLAFDRAAGARGLYSRSVNADAFSDETKAQVADVIRNDLGPIDLLVYSLASPTRTDPDTGVTYRSAIKPIGRSVHTKTLNVDKGVVHETDLAPASDEEIVATVKVMGGEDWERWIDRLQEQQLLASGFKTIAYTYIGSELTWPIYWRATLGKAKEDLDRAALGLRASLAPIGGDARVAVLKAVVTQASAAIPVVPLYVSLLFKVMKERGLHEGCLAHIDRLFRTRVYNGAQPSPVDAVGRLRADDWELREDVQAEVKKRWEQVDTSNIFDISDLAGFRQDFLRVFGFEARGVDYDADVSPLD
jgi:enoyl-[acyl-carrier protein] reductase / trans-2-enoyl-CoA reductase (NAD+)